MKNSMQAQLPLPGSLHSGDDEQKGQTDRHIHSTHMNTHRETDTHTLMKNEVSHEQLSGNLWSIWLNGLPPEVFEWDQSSLITMT